ncbi:MAG: hypothetical protein JJ992_14730 [Planctomycetes bacterium]|nr:hypothetical protein [Planctomycetota bacterium]
MNKTMQTALAAILVILLLGAIGVVSYLAFVFPSTVAAWADQGRQLSIAEQALAEWSVTCRSHGLSVLAILLPAVIGSGIWLAIAATSHRDASLGEIAGFKVTERSKP